MLKNLLCYAEFKYLLDKILYMSFTKVTLLHWLVWLGIHQITRVLCEKKWCRLRLRARILVQATMYRGLRIGRDGPEAYDISWLVREYGSRKGHTIIACEGCDESVYTNPTNTGFEPMWFNVVPAPKLVQHSASIVHGVVKACGWHVATYECLNLTSVSVITP